MVSRKSEPAVAPFCVLSCSFSIHWRLRRPFGAIDDGVGLEIQKQAARVDIDGADHREPIVNEDDFRMHHAADETDDADSGRRGVAQRLAAGEISDEMIEGSGT